MICGHILARKQGRTSKVPRSEEWTVSKKREGKKESDGYVSPLLRMSKEEISAWANAQPSADPSRFREVARRWFAETGNRDPRSDGHCDERIESYEPLERKNTSEKSR